MQRATDKLIAAGQGGFIVLYVWEIVVRKIPQISKVATLLDFIFWFDRVFQKSR